MGKVHKTPVHCFASQHMNLKEFAVYDVCMRLTKGGSRVLYFDGVKMAARFTGVSKSSIYRAIESLVDKGWLIPLDKDRQRKEESKQWTATRYQVVPHDHWILKKGTKHCTDQETEPFPKEGTEPFPKQGTEPFPKPSGPIPKTERTHSHSRDVSSYTPLSSVKDSSDQNLSISVGGASAHLHKEENQNAEKVQGHPVQAAIPSNGNGSDFAKVFGGDIANVPMWQLLENLTPEENDLWAQRSGGDPHQLGRSVYLEIIRSRK